MEEARTDLMEIQEECLNDLFDSYDISPQVDPTESSMGNKGQVNLDDSWASDPSCCSVSVSEKS